MAACGDSLFDSVEDAHEQAGQADGFGRLGDVVVVDLAMTGRIADHALRIA
jgi:hypothetical protein